MKHTTVIISGALLAIFFTTTSYGDDNQIKGLQTQIDSYRLEIEQLKQKIAEKDEEIEKIKEFCLALGFTPPPKSGRFPIIEQSFWGIKLGQDFSELQKEHPIIRPLPSQDGDDLSQTYELSAANSDISSISVCVYKDQVLIIVIRLATPGQSMFDSITRGIESKYKIIKRSEPISLEKVINYSALVDNKRVEISVKYNDIVTKYLIITYSYFDLGIDMMVTQKKQDAKRIDGDL